MRGAKPKSTAMLKLAGGWRISQRKNTPEPENGVPDKPMWLSPETEKSWDDIITLLAPMKILTKVDGIAIGQMAEYLTRYREVTAKIAEIGMLIPITSGNTTNAWKKNPYVAMQLDYGHNLQRMMSEFGMTPSARARVKIADIAQAKSDNLLSRGKAISS